MDLQVPATQQIYEGMDINQLGLLISKIEIKYDLPKIFHSSIGTDEGRLYDVQHLCVDVKFVVEYYIYLDGTQSSQEKNGKESEDVQVLRAACVKFFKSSLTIITELLLRRKTAVEHEDDLADYFVIIARLVALPSSTYIIELCELRNLLVMHNTTSWKFINPKPLKVNSITTSSFFTDHGRPNVACFHNGSRVAFWPDEWRKVLGGQGAVGHFVSTCVGTGAADDAQAWRTGQVVEYLEGENVYKVEFDDAVSDVSASSENDIDKAKAKAARVALVDLETTKHHWADTTNLARIGANSKLQSGPQQISLSNSDKDVGRYIRIWWSRYNRYFYGQITAFTVTGLTQRHGITYEDGDTRDYDLKQRKWEIVIPPDSLALPENATAAQSAGVVGAWHREAAAAQSSTMSSAMFPSHSDSQPCNPSSQDKYALERPFPSTSPSIPSLFFIRMINSFFLAGGMRAMVDSLSNTAQTPPLVKIIIADIQFARSVRSLLSSDVLQSMSAEIGEAVVSAIRRLDDSHFKHVTPLECNELFFVLADLMPVTSTVAAARGTNEKKKMELLRLDLAARMLRCSQLQKRYLGLAMIKEVVDALLPSAASFVARRTALLTASKQGMQAPAIHPMSGGQGSESSLSSSAFEQWLVHNEIVDELFGSSLHQDLVSKSDVILVFLAHRRVLSEKHVGVLWASSQGAHEAVTRVIHHLILVLVPVLHSTLRMHLFGLIANFTPRECSEQLLHLLKSFTVQAVAAAKDEGDNRAISQNLNSDSAFVPIGAQSVSDIASGASDDASSRKAHGGALGRMLGFSVLWDLAVDRGSAGEALAENLCNLAVQLLVELLQSDFPDERETVMRKCIDNILGGHSVAASLQILRKTLGTYPLPTRNWLSLTGRSAATAKNPTIEFQIDKLQRQHRMMDAVFHDLERSSREGPISATKGSHGHLGQLEKHHKEVSERLDFLRFVLSRSTLSLEFRQCCLIWQALGEGAASLETVDKLVRWLDNLLVQEGKQSFGLMWQNLAQESDPANPTHPSRIARLAIFMAEKSKPTTNQSSAVPRAASASQLEATTWARSEEGERSVFDEGVLVRLFESRILKWAIRSCNIEVISRPPVAAFLLKIFLLANIYNKAIKVESDGSWARVGQLRGLALLWRLAIDCKEMMVAEAAMGLLVELHHRMPPRFRGSDFVRSYLLRMSFKQLSVAIQSVRAGDTAGAAAVPQATSLETPDSAAAVELTSSNIVVEAEGFPVVVQTSSPANRAHAGARGHQDSVQTQLFDDWFEEGDGFLDAAIVSRRVSRFVALLQLFIRRFHLEPCHLLSVRVLHGQEEANAFVLVTNSNETLGSLRTRVAEYFKEPSSNMIMFHSAKGVGLFTAFGGQERLERDDLTLRQARFQQQDTIIAKKKEVVVGTGGTITAGAVSEAKKATPNEETVLPVPDIIAPSDLKTNLLSVLYPLYWLDGRAIRQPDAPNVSSSSGDSLPTLVASLPSMLNMPPAPLPTRLDATLLPESRSAHLARSDVDSNQPVSIAEHLGATLHSSSGHADQLLAMLDGYLSANLLDHENKGVAPDGSDLCSAVWDVLQSLPVHPALLKQVRDMPLDSTGGAILRCLDRHNLYRLLYTLQLIDSLLSETNDLAKGHPPEAASRALAEWATKFIYLGGPDHLVGLLNTLVGAVLTNEESPVATTRDQQPDTERCEGEGEVGPESAQRVVSVTRDDAHALSIAYLYRIFHRLLLFDPFYSDWQIDAHAFRKMAATRSGFSQVPNGLVLSSVDPAAFIKQAFSVSIALSKRVATPQSRIAASSVEAVAENALRLVFGLVAACDEGAGLLNFPLTEESLANVKVGTTDMGGLEHWIRSMCLLNSSPRTRLSCCRRILQASTALLFLSTDRAVPTDKRMDRWNALDLLHSAVIRSIEDTPSTTLMPSSQPGLSLVPSAEEAFSLVSALVALRVSPELIFNRELLAKSRLKEALSELPCGTGNSSTQHLCQLFLEKLFGHRSLESFHSRKPDGSLLGILRVLLVLASGESAERHFLGSYTQPSLRGAQSHASSAIDAIDTADSMKPPAPSPESLGQLIPHLYHRRLFPGGNNGVTALPLRDGTDGIRTACVTKESRDLAYALLFQLCVTDEKNLLSLVTVMGGPPQQPTPQAISLRPTSRPSFSALSLGVPSDHVPWSYHPGGLMKDRDEHIGLVNQGATCYMNSFLQQLFHQPAFADGLLRLEAPGDSVLSDESDSAAVLAHLQTLFGYLKYGQKRYYDPLPFCQVFRDYDGQPISLYEQKDANEFAIMLFEKLESHGACKRLLESTVQGKVAYLTKSTETNYRSCKVEPFYMITAEAKDKAALEDSLELMVAEELFTGESKLEDPVSGRRVEALRRCVFRHLPPTLIIHLKRFEFDLETLGRRKVNDLITFPMELNMYPYTEEGLAEKEARMNGGREAASLQGDRENDGVGQDGGGHGAFSDQQSPFTRHPPGYYGYNLVGIVAHSGTLDRGHYYSFIKNRASQAWHEYNDRSVMPFSPDNIPLECFGGPERINGAGGAVRMRQNNAYLLVYERSESLDEASAMHTNEGEPGCVRDGDEPVLPSPAAPLLASEVERETVLPPPPPEPHITTLDSTDQTSSTISPVLPPPPLVVGVAQRSLSHAPILGAVLSENARFLTDRCLFDAPHFRFMWQIMQMPSVIKALRSPLLAQTLNASTTATTAGSCVIKSDGQLNPGPEPTGPLTQSSSTSRDLGSLGLVCLQFSVEVLSRARAQACVPMFFERLEELVLQDVSKRVALAMLTMLASDPVDGSEGGPVSQGRTLSCSPQTSERAMSSTRSQTIQRHEQRDRECMGNYCHPWLVQMFFLCPYAATTRAFSKLLLACLRALRSSHKDIYLTVGIEAQTGGERAPCTPSKCTAPTDPESSTDITEEKHVSAVAEPPTAAFGSDRPRREEPSGIEAVDSEYLVTLGETRFAPARRGLSCVTRFLHKLIFLAEKNRSCSNAAQSGSSSFRALSSLLLQFAVLGHEERQVLLSLGTVYRIVCSLLTLSTVSSGMSAEHLAPAYELVAMLVRSSAVTPAAGGRDDQQESSRGSQSPFAQPNIDVSDLFSL